MSEAPNQLSADTAQQSPEAYVEAIRAFSQLSQDEHLSCGGHYRELALLFQPPSLASTTAAYSATGNSVSDSFCFVTAVEISQLESGEQQRQVRELSSPRAFSSAPQIGPNCSQLIFLKGYPSHDWLRTLGATFRVDPEFWRRHHALGSSQNIEYHDLPPLRSFSSRTAQLRINTIFNRHDAVTRQEVETWRVESFDRVRRHHVDVERNSSVGDSIVRQIHAHSESIFTIEQNISCTIVTKNGGWAALVWQDIGKPLSSSIIDSDNHGPGHNHVRKRADFCVPIIQHTPKAALYEYRPAAGGSANSLLGSPLRNGPGTMEPRTGSATQSSSFLPAQYGKSLKLSAMRASPLYALSDVFRHSACSSNQKVNMLHIHADEALRRAHRDESLSLADLRFIKKVLDDHAAYLREVIAFLEGATAAWIIQQPQLEQAASSLGVVGASSTNGKKAGAGAGEKKMISDVTETTQRELFEDFRHLLHRVEKLADRCKDGTDIILSGAQLRESQKAIDQAEEVKMLTKLVFIFAPLSFLTSVFGMNFVAPSWRVGVGVFFAGSVLLAICLSMIMYQSPRLLAKKISSYLST